MAMAEIAMVMAGRQGSAFVDWFSANLLAGLICVQGIFYDDIHHTIRL